MKIYKIIFTIILGLVIGSCSLTEDPPFLSNDSAFATLGNSRSTLDGVYNALAGYNNMGFFYHYMIGGNSGFFVSGKGNRNTAADNVNLCSLKPLPNSVHLEKLWGSLYQTIVRANDVIASVPEVIAPATNDDVGMNDVLGQAYFIRAYSYFNLVRLWGAVPLRLEPTTVDNVNMPKSSAKIVFEQIIKDADAAQRLMLTKEMQRPGYPANLAASMLAAKVYVHLATADPEIQDAGSAYWTLAYNEAKEVYGAYTLVSDYATLWEETGGNNTQESIFEVQFNDVATSNLIKLYTGSQATMGATWGRLKINPEVYDLHAAIYPGDQRIDETFISSYVKPKNGATQKSYPTITSRNNFKAGFPYLYKYWEKNSSNTTSTNLKNFIIFRYADLLLTLAEISNELQNGEEMGYVTEVLARVGMTPQAEYSNGQDAFRDAIMKEYRFELLGEGQDWFNNRRRGYDFFRTNVIVPHNTAPTFKASVDVTLLDNDESVMLLPYPSSEINANQEINN